MEHAARKFARRVLLIHFLLLAVAVALVIFAAREVYLSARRQAIEQMARRQALFADQTATSIAHLYGEIVRSLQLPHGQDPSMAPAVWHQLEGRASCLFSIERGSLKVLLAFPVSDGPERAEMIVKQAGPWLANVTGPQVSSSVKISQDNQNIVAIPAGDDPRILLCAAVPIREIDRQFLQGIHDQPLMSAVLLDEKMKVLAAADDRIIGLSVIDQGSSAAVRQIAKKYLQLGQPGTEVIEKGFTLGTHPFDSGIVNIQPIDILGTRWWLSLGTDLADVDALVKRSLDHALVLGVMVVVFMSVILVSTAVQMISSRMRMERVKHELLMRELSQARKIQLAWLPKNEDDPPHIDLSAINLPTSHVSGDFYNWFNLPDGRVCVVIGDVTGHGMAATFLMATTQLLVRMVMPKVMDPGRCLEEINRQLCGQAFNGQFVTMLILVLDRRRGRIEVATAGHPAPLVISPSGIDELKLDPQLVLGVESDSDYPTTNLDLPNGANLVLYTDGVADAQAIDGRRFGVEGIRACIGGNFANAQAIADCVLSAIDTFRTGRELADDLTLVTIQLEPVSDPGDAMAAAI